MIKYNLVCKCAEIPLKVGFLVHHEFDSLT